MALNTATTLKAAVQDWLDRSDYSTVSDDMVTLAEGHFNLELRTREMVEQATLTPTNGVCTIPSDFLGVIRVVADASPRYVLNYLGANAVDKKHDATIGGTPVSYTIIGDELHTFPQSNVDIELTYWEKIPSLNSNSSNWLLAKYPNLYLEACMMEAHRYFPNAEKLQIASTRVGNMIARLNESSMVETIGDGSRTSWDYTP